MAEEEPHDAAAEAFESLRVDVADVRAALESLPTVLKGISGPDYSPTLAAMAQTLERIEAHPALQYTAHRYASEVGAVTEAFRTRVEHDGHQALNVIGQAARDVSRFAGELRTREQQRSWLIRASGGGVVVGAVLWALVSGPIARRLPAKWHVPETTAAATLWMNRWEAGEQLLRTADTARWNRTLDASSVWRSNASRLEACVRTATETRKAQRCTVTLEPEDFKGRPPG